MVCREAEPTSLGGSLKRLVSPGGPVAVFVAQSLRSTNFPGPLALAGALYVASQHFPSLFLSCTVTGCEAGSGERSRATPVPRATISALPSGPGRRRREIELLPPRPYVNRVAPSRQHGRPPQVPPGGIPPRAMVCPFPS